MFRRVVLFTLLSAGAVFSEAQHLSAPAVPRAIVHKAYRYAGSGALRADAGMQLVAIDVEFRDYDSGLDLDDVEIADAASGQVFESAPEIAFLKSDGSFYAWREAPPDGSMRPLLIFQIPTAVSSVSLRLADEIITRAPVKIQRSGPTLPAERRHP